MAFVAKRAAAPGETLRQDVVVRGKIKGSPGRLLVNEVTVRPAGPGRVEYREVLHWQGEVPKEITAPQPEMLKALRDTLPPALTTDEAVLRDVALLTQRELYRMLFGPGDLILGYILLHPDLAERRIQQRLGGALLKALEAKFGDRMTLAERRGAARKILTAALAASEVSSKAKSGPEMAAAGGPGGGDKDGNAPVALTFAVKAPGKVIETNGEYDELSGEIFWTLYPEAAAAGDVVLSAVCEVSPGPAAAASSGPSARR